MTSLLTKLVAGALLLMEVSRAEELEMPSWLRETRQEIGVGCRRHSDCGDGARCIIGSCQCLDSHIQVEGGRCLRKLSPGQTPCFRDEQCQAAWPSARCVNTMCQCTQGSKVRTRDGIVCVGQGTCPLGGAEAVLKDSSGAPVACQIDSVGMVTGCAGQLHMYDCITTSPSRTGTGWCCPNKASTCSMSPRLGSSFGGLSSASSWHYNSVSGECGQGGGGGSANSFGTKEQCENYCASCPRGSPLFHSGTDGLPEQFVQQERTCDPQAPNACPDYRFDCNIIRPGKALCCPSREFICGPSGGAAESANQGRGYAEGIPCGPQAGAQQRYYFDSTTRQCLPFQYQGCGGNFNNFVSQDDCMKMCSPDQSGVSVVGLNLLGGVGRDVTPPPYEPSGNGGFLGGRGVGSANPLQPSIGGDDRNQMAMYSLSDALALGGRPDLRVIENGRLMGGISGGNFGGTNYPQFGGQQSTAAVQNPFAGGPTGRGILPWNVNHDDNTGGQFNSLSSSSNGLASNSLYLGSMGSNPIQTFNQPLFTPLNLQSLAGMAIQYEENGPKAFGPLPWYASG